MYKQLLSTLIPATIGASAALVVVALTKPDHPNEERRERDAAPLAASAPKAGVQYRHVEAQWDEGRVGRIEDRLEAIQAEQELNEERGAPDAAKEREFLEQHYGQLDRDFEKDAPDPAWSAQATGFLKTSLESYGKTAGFEVVASECRGKTCRATMSWKTFDEARNNGGSLAERLIPGLNCMRSIWLKEPEEDGKPYSANLYLDCSEQRAGIAQPIPHAIADQATL